jgi:hypothetical protein
VFDLIEIATDRDNYQDTDTWLGACRIVNQAIQTALNMQARADESSLQAQRISRLDDIIKLIQDEEKRMPLIVVDA